MIWILDQQDEMYNLNVCILALIATELFGKAYAYRLL